MVPLPRCDTFSAFLNHCSIVFSILLFQLLKYQSLWYFCRLFPSAHAKIHLYLGFDLTECGFLRVLAARPLVAFMERICDNLVRVVAICNHLIRVVAFCDYLFSSALFLLVCLNVIHTLKFNSYTNVGAMLVQTECNQARLNCWGAAENRTLIRCKDSAFLWNKQGININ